MKLSKGFWSGVEALKNWSGEREKGIGVYFKGGCGYRGLCAMGVMNVNSNNDLFYMGKGHGIINQTNFPTKLLTVAEDLYEGWAWRHNLNCHTKAAIWSKLTRQWSHQEVGAWLEKVGKGIECKAARASEFNCEPYHAKNWFIKPNGVTSYYEVEHEVQTRKVS